MTDTIHMSTRNTIQDPNTFKALEKLPALYATDGSKGDRPAVKLFDSRGSYFAVIWEYDADAKEGFGYASMAPGMGELGYISVAELEALGLRIERDLYAKTMVEGMESRGIDVPEYLMEEEIA